MIDSSRIDPGEDITSMFPWKIWTFSNPSGLTSRAIDFFQPSSNTAELLAIYDRALRMADDETGIPAYAYGSEVQSGAGRTATGLGMLMNAAMRGIKEIIGRIDSDVIQPLIEQFFTWNMIYNPDESIKGDCKVKTKGAMGLMLLELKQAKLTEFINQTANPVDMQIVGLAGRAKLLRESADLQNINTKGIIPSEEEVFFKQREQERQQAIQQQIAIQQQQVGIAEAKAKANKESTTPVPKGNREDRGGYNTAGTAPNIENQEAAMTG
jgi:hypothetical protein